MVQGTSPLDEAGVSDSISLGGLRTLEQGKRHYYWGGLPAMRFKPSPAGSGGSFAAGPFDHTPTGDREPESASIELAPFANHSQPRRGRGLTSPSSMMIGESSTARAPRDQGTKVDELVVRKSTDMKNIGSQTSQDQRDQKSRTNMDLRALELRPEETLVISPIRRHQYGAGSNDLINFSPVSGPPTVGKVLKSGQGSGDAVGDDKRRNIVSTFRFADKPSDTDLGEPSLPKQKKAEPSEQVRCISRETRINTKVKSRA